MSVDEFQLARNFWGYLSYKGTNFIVVNTSEYFILKSDMKAFSYISRKDSLTRRDYEQKLRTRHDY